MKSMLRGITKSLRLLLIGVACVAMYSLLLWFSNTWQVLQLWRDTMPMAPTTSITIIILCALIVTTGTKSPSRNGRLIQYSISGIVLANSIYVLVMNYHHLGIPLFDRLFATNHRNMDQFLGAMSTPSAIMSIMTLLSIYTMQIVESSRKYVTYLGVMIGVSSILMCFELGVASITQSDINTLGSFSQMAFSATIAFTLLNVALLWRFADDRLSAQRLQNVNKPIRSNQLHSTAVYAFIVIFAVISWVTIVLLKNSYHNYRENAGTNLAIIADQKTEEIQNWYHNLITDATQIYESPILQDIAITELQIPDNRAINDKLYETMKSRLKNFEYAEMSLFDHKGTIVMNVSKGLCSSESIQDTLFNKAIRKNQIVISDIHLNRDNPDINTGAPHINIWIPVTASPKNPSAKIYGAWLVQIDPYNYLFPSLGQWPSYSLTGETIIVRREGSDVVFLNHLRYGDKQPLGIRLNIEDNPQELAVIAVKGFDGVTEGLDYRGIPVMASLQTVRGTPWVTIVEIDMREVFAMLRVRVWLILSFVIVLMIITSFGMFFWENYREKTWYIRQLGIEHESKRAAERTAALVKYANDVVLMLDNQWNIIEANHKAQTTYGYTERELLSLNLRDLRVERERVQLDLLDWDELQRSGLRIETTHICKDGTEIIVDSSMHSIIVDDQQYRQAIIRDITDRKRDIEDLRLTHDYLENLIDYANAPIIVWDPHYYITRFNAAFERLSGFSDTEVIGNKLTILFPPSARNAAMAKIESTLQGQHWESVEIPILRKDGAVRTALWNSANIFDKTGTQIVGTIAQGQDITYRIQAEERINKLNAELENRVTERTAQLSAANKELEAFSHSVAHDLRAPLRGIDGWSQILSEEYANVLDSRGHKYIHTIIDEAHRMGDLIDALLDFSRITRKLMVFDQCNLSDIAATAVQRLRGFEPDRTLEIIIEPDLYDRVDPKMMEVALFNLLSNAFKFTVPITHPLIEFGKTQVDGVSYYYVKDNGVGFDMTCVANLFGTFQRLHKSIEFPGTGIGLATVKRIITRHGGSIWATSEPLINTIFYFTLREESNEQ